MKKQETLYQQRQIVESLSGISRLQNSIYYFLDCVFITISEEDYRLIILHHDQVIMNTHYNTLRGAKIAFAKFFNERAWAEDVQPQWSECYKPEKGWLEEKFAVLAKNRTRHRVDNLATIQ